MVAPGAFRAEVDDDSPDHLWLGAIAVRANPLRS